MTGRRQYGRILLGGAAAACTAGVAAPARARTATVNVSNTQVGTTLEHVGYNMGHYLPGSNTSAWVDYSGVNAFRVWAASSDYEVRHGSEANRDDIAPWGDGVSNLPTFNARKAALRNDPLNESFIDWTEFNGYFQNKTQTGRNAVKLNHILGELHDRDIHVIQQTTRTPTAGPIAGESDWAGKWEQWQHYYAMAFHSARHYDVAQWQMYNEPNGDPTTNVTDFNIRLKLASDAIRSAVQDVNRIYSKSLVPDVAAPTTAGGSARVDDWGRASLQQIRTDYQGQTVDYDVFNTYAAQVYEQTGAGFGNEVAAIKNKIPLHHAGGAAAGQAMPLIFSEFNRHGSNNLADADMADVDLNTPYVFTDIASTYVNAMARGAKSMYAFKFSQTMWTPRQDAGEPEQSEQPQKTGFHYVSDTGTKDVTGATVSAGVVRLFAKGFSDERARLSATTSTSLGGTYDLATSFDAVGNDHYLFGVNRSAAESHELTFDLSGWDVQPGTLVMVEEVSARHNGEVTHLLQVPGNRRLTLTQPAQSVWLLTVPSVEQPRAVLGAAADAQVRNGAAAGNDPAYNAQNYGRLAHARVGRSPDSAQFDHATYLKFDTAGYDADDVSRAILQLTGQSRTSAGGGAGPILFHVYALANDAWTEDGITWLTAPNLSAADAKLTGVGTTAFPVGQLTFADGIQQFGIDLTQFLRDHPDMFNDGSLSLALVREERFAGDADAASSFVELLTRESSWGAPQLTLIVPEPGSMTLLALAGIGLLARRVRRP